jgi:hypothetical protein
MGGAINNVRVTNDYCHPAMQGCDCKLQYLPSWLLLYSTTIGGHRTKRRDTSSQNQNQNLSTMQRRTQAQASENSCFMHCKMKRPNQNMGRTGEWGIGTRRLGGNATLEVGDAIMDRAQLKVKKSTTNVPVVKQQ